MQRKKNHTYDNYGIMFLLYKAELSSHLTEFREYLKIIIVFFFNKYKL